MPLSLPPRHCPTLTKDAGQGNGNMMGCPFVRQSRRATASADLLRPLGKSGWIPFSRRVCRDPVRLLSRCSCALSPIRCARLGRAQFSISLGARTHMQVHRPIDDDFRRFRVAVAPFSAPLQRSVKGFGKTLPVDEIRLDVTYHCNLCGVATRLDTKTTAGKLLCQGCRRSELQRQSSLEDIRPASPMAGKPKALHPVKTDGRVHPSWMLTEVESEAETAELSSSVTTEHLHSFRAEDAGSFRSMEVLTCFRAEVHRGLRLLLKATTAEKWHMWWAMLLSMLLLPMILTLMVVAGVGFLVLSTWVAIVGVVVYPLAYINPRLYNYAMDS